MEEWHTGTTACDEGDKTLDGEEVAHVDRGHGGRGGCYGGGHSDFADRYLLRVVGVRDMVSEAKCWSSVDWVSEDVGNRITVRLIIDSSSLDSDSDTLKRWMEKGRKA